MDCGGFGKVGGPLSKGGDGNCRAADDPGRRRTGSALQAAGFVQEGAARFAGMIRSVPEGLGTVAGGTTTGSHRRLEEHPGGAR